MARLRLGPEEVAFDGHGTRLAFARPGEAEAWSTGLRRWQSAEIARRRPVRFGEHRLMFRPRDSHDMRLLETKLTISPPAQVRWLHDVFGNSVAIASFGDMAEELRFESEIRLEHYGVRETASRSTAAPRPIRSSMRRKSCRI